MNKQPEALRLADEFDSGEWISSTGQWREEAAAELRRLNQSEREGWRYAEELEQERKRLNEANQAMLEALKMSLEICDGCSRGFLSKVQEKARAAIAKGEQQCE